MRSENMPDDDGAIAQLVELSFAHNLHTKIRVLRYSRALLFL